MKMLHIATVCLVLAGCQAGPPVQRSAADDPSAICLAGMDKHSALAVLRPRIGSAANAQTATPDLLTSTAIPTAEEKKAIQSWAGLRRECVNAGAEFRLKNAPPAYADLVEEENARFTVLLSQLYAGQAGYGRFLTERIALDTEMKSRLNNARGEHERANAPIRQEEAARRRAELTSALTVLQLAPAPPGKN